MARGKFLIVFGPSGSGKNELIRHARSLFSDIEFPLTYTTRERRIGLENESYRFVSTDEFEKKVAAGEFLEWAEFAGNFYATLREEIKIGIEKGKVLIKEMEVQGIQQTLEKLPREDVKLVFVDAGSWETLERRARARAPITDDAIAKRKLRYVEEMAFLNTTGADIRIDNPDGELDAAKEAFERVIREAKENALGW